MSHDDSTNLLEQMRRFESLLQQAEAISDPESKQLVHHLIAGLMDLHREALSRLLTRLGHDDPDQSRLLDLASDDVIASLLLLYNLHPQDLPTRVQAALQKVRPAIVAHGGSLDLLHISDDGVVQLSLNRGGHACPSSATTVQTTIEQAIYNRAPDVTSIEIHQEPAPAKNGFVSLESLAASAARNHLTQQHLVQGVPA